MIKLLVLIWSLTLAACVELSPAGAQVRVFREEQAAELDACQALGQVSVSSEDALRNAAAALSGDTALLTIRDAGGSFYIRGTVYRCSTGTTRASAIVTNPSVSSDKPVNVSIENEKAPETDTQRKSAKCREKGGEWTGVQCVIKID